MLSEIHIWLLYFQNLYWSISTATSSLISNIIIKCWAGAIILMLMLTLKTVLIVKFFVTSCFPISDAREYWLKLCWSSFSSLFFLDFLYLNLTASVKYLYKKQQFCSNYWHDIVVDYVADAKEIFIYLYHVLRHYPVSVIWL